MASLTFLMDSMIIVLVIIAGALIIIYNALVSLRNNVNKAWSNIDVLLQKRHDLIGNLVEVVKGYQRYEKTLLVKLTDMRTSWAGVQQSGDVKQKISASNQITGALKTMFANVENYPDLKADNNFMQLQQSLVDIENQIAERREFYNDTVNEYNTKIMVVPFVFFADILGYRALPYFQAAGEARNVVNVDL